MKNTKGLSMRVDAPLVFSMQPARVASKKTRVHLEEMIAQELKNSESHAFSHRAISAYSRCVQALGLEDCVHLSGPCAVETARIKSCIMQHELKSPRFSVVKFIEQISRLPPTGENMLRLVELARASISCRFTLYKNVYNLDIAHRGKRIFNYHRILERLWMFHRKYKHFIIVLFNTVHHLSGYAEEYKRAEVTYSGTLELVKEKDLYMEIHDASLRVMECIKSGAPVSKEDIVALKGFKQYYSHLVCSVYGFCGHGQNDLLFIFGEMFNKDGKVKSAQALENLLSAIGLHISGFYSIIQQTYKNKKMPNDLRNKVVRKAMQNLNVFLYKNPSVFLYIVIPVSHKLAGYSACIWAILHIIHSYSTSACFSSKAPHPLLARAGACAFLGAVLLLTANVANIIRKDSVHTKHCPYTHINRHIYDLACIVFSFTAYSFICRGGLEAIYRVPARVAVGAFSAFMLSVFVLDSQIRLQPVFPLQRKKNLIMALAYVLTTVFIGMMQTL
ncbi:uncharacterized protein NEMAJ01_0151 [Nematocida major]|uniref:uncharacterized protein n=1 Tax=Nematocida major TaxID=1912982 RepID=UPI002008089F|nr:uncharacterized protein NEMAJ01_0151 [Nematocida major]KAH9385255.1 hypothetical protein NEMAJ01_0151 [Nematocida major]